MRTLFRVLRVVLILVIILGLGFVIVIGPWPVYRDSDFENASYYKEGIANGDASAQGEVDATPPALSRWAGASWI